MTKKKVLTPEEIAENDLRTTPRGIFWTAEAYWEAARVVDAAKMKATRHRSPIRFLYYHALELYLKAYLRAKGCTVQDLYGMGHRYKALLEAAKGFGLKVQAEDASLLTSLGMGDAWIRARYIRTGLARVGWYATSTLNASCERLDHLVRDELEALGISTANSDAR
jgi:hypothetical protein